MESIAKQTLTRKPEHFPESTVSATTCHLTRFQDTAIRPLLVELPECILAPPILSKKGSNNISKRREKIMKTLFTCAVLTIIASFSAAGIATAADTDPVVGTWQLDASRSTFKTGPAIKSQTRTYSQSGNHLTLEMKTLTADGKESTTHTSYQLDGKSYPVTGTPDYDSLTGKKIDNNTTEFTLMKGGKAVGTTNRTVSKDGKTLTTHAKITGANGQKSEFILIFTRQ